MYGLECEAVVWYCSDAVIKVIRGLYSYKDHDYDTLKNDLIFIYDGERAETEYGIADMYPLVKKWSKTKIHDLSTYKDYLKEFQTIAGWLHVWNKINDDEFKLWFWAGLPKKLQKKIEDQLRIEDPLQQTIEVMAKTHQTMTPANTSMTGTTLPCMYNVWYDAWWLYVWCMMMYSV